MKICAECSHHTGSVEQDTREESYMCWYDGQELPRSSISGRVIPITCYIARSAAGHCGADGIHWESLAEWRRKYETELQELKAQAAMDKEAARLLRKPWWQRWFG